MIFGDRSDRSDRSAMSDSPAQPGVDLGPATQIGWQDAAQSIATVPAIHAVGHGVACFWSGAVLLLAGAERRLPVGRSRARAAAGDALLGRAGPDVDGCNRHATVLPGP